MARPLANGALTYGLASQPGDEFINGHARVFVYVVKGSGGTEKTKQAVTA